MRIPNTILKTVAFLCTPASDESKSRRWDYGGTAFFVRVPSESDAGRGHTYLITARHCVEKGKKAGQLHARLNTKQGGVTYSAIEGEWFYPESESSDIAVYGPWTPGNDIDYRALSSELFPTQEMFTKHQVGIGDELQSVGLFTLRQGSTKNLPIARTGIIAAMPDEPLQDDAGEDYYAYLAELRSIGGLSGCPVFVVLEAFRSGSFQRVPILLGVIRGHWQYDSRLSSDDASENMNIGIAQVTPFEEVMEVLYRDDLAKVRRKLES